MLERVWLPPTVYALHQFRRLVNINARVYALMNTARVQPFLRGLGRLKAYGIYLDARQSTPAYKKFLCDVGPKRLRDWATIPPMTKETYVKPYSIEERCYGGCIPPVGTVIDESSGSSGPPNNWVRGSEERARATRAMQLNYELIGGGKRNFLLNCFALGPWATGMNVSMSLAEVGILKSLGPDQLKLENTLRQFGPNYRYMLFGYPPFVKHFVDTTTLDLTQYDLHCVIGGEGLSEAMRSHLEKHFTTVLSSYGASDIEINIASESELTVAIRRRCDKDASLSRDLFGRDTPPMIFQYNPLDHYIETTGEGELLFTVTRIHTAAPKIRYNLHDAGGVWLYDDLKKKLSAHGIDIDALAPRRSHFPFVFVFGRNDMTVPFYGAKVSPVDFENVIASDPSLTTTFNSFQFGRRDSDDGDARLLIRLECLETVSCRQDVSTLRDRLIEGLMRVNQDFREVSKMFESDRISVEVYPYAAGPFAQRDGRLKNHYLLPNA